MSRRSAPVVHLPVDVLTRLAERSDADLEAGLAKLVGSGVELPAGLRALVDRPHLALESGRPWRVLGVALRRVAHRRHSAEELLSREAFAFWHEGTYWLNTALPGQALERWAQHLAGAHRHQVEAAAKALAQETRRRRKPKEAVARLVWSQELGALFDAVKLLGEGVKVDRLGG